MVPPREHFILTAPASPDEVRDTLGRHVEATRNAHRSPDTKLTVVGRVEGSSILLSTVRGWSASSFSPLLRAELTRLPDGRCQIVGTVGAARWVRTFTAVWATGIARAILFLCGATARDIASDRVTAGDVAFAVAWIVMTSAFMVAIPLLFRQSERDQERLMHWLEHQVLRT